MIDFILWAVMVEAVVIGWLVYQLIKVDQALNFILPDALKRIQDLEDRND